MKRLIFVLLIVWVSNLNAQPNTLITPQECKDKVRDLSGLQWRMKMMLPGQCVKAGLHQIPPEDIETLVWNIAEVPGDVYTDLWKCGGIDDPYFGRNTVKAQWVQHYEWWYALQFNVIDTDPDRIFKLLFEGVDYSCEVWLNGQYLGKHTGAFSSFSFDVNKALRISKDRLSSTNMLMVKLDPPPMVNAQVAGKKTPWFGDYWRDLVLLIYFVQSKSFPRLAYHITDYEHILFHFDHRCVQGLKCLLTTLFVIVQHSLFRLPNDYLKQEYHPSITDVIDSAPPTGRSLNTVTTSSFFFKAMV